MGGGGGVGRLCYAMLYALYRIAKSTLNQDPLSYPPLLRA